ncbi:MAG: hypothetical protein Q4D90_05210 [bacterium]|nr:hypothetical protein [bacterium]
MKKKFTYFLRTTLTIVCLILGVCSLPQSEEPTETSQETTSEIQPIHNDDYDGF